MVIKMEIPKQLHNQELRFVLLGKWDDVIYDKNNKPKYRGKAPFENKWQTENNYTFDNPKLLNHPNNFGVIGGYGRLRILDIDEPKLAEEFEKNLNTYTVKTGSGGRHFYFTSDYDTNHVLINELGELRANKYQVVSAPCRHPSGNYYSIIKDVPIAEISSEELLSIIKPYLREEQQSTEIVLNKDKKQDTSRSGLEFRKVLALLREKKSREDVYKIMEAYSKWASANEQYRNLTFEKAENLYLLEQEKESKPQIKEVSREDAIKVIQEQYPNIKKVLQSYLDLKEDYYTILSIWIVGTYLHKEFESFPYLFFNAMRGSGKSKTLRLSCKLAREGNVMASPTEAVLFRVNGTLGIDEFEGVANKDKSSIRELLNGAYKKGIKIYRMRKKKTPEGEMQVAEEFEPYRPIIMANISGMEEVLEDRCITLILEKSDDPVKTRFVEDFDTNEMIKIVLERLKTLKECRVCSDEMTKNIYSTQNINTLWNMYVSDKHNYTHSTYTTHTTYTTHLTLNKALFDKIYNSNIMGRNLELFLPLFFIAGLISEDLLLDTIRIAKSITSEKKHEQEVESLDVMFIDFISKQDGGLNYLPAKDLVRNFRDFSDTNEEEVNTKWFGLALKRLNLLIDKRRKGTGVNYLLNVAKAKEKIKMFQQNDIL
jgi:hypothetical protein